VSACAAAIEPQPVRFIGRSAAIRTVEEEAERAARSGAKILITGETGVGKEVVARFVHRRSTRAAAPLVTVNCAGLPDTLLESELFGHVRGSFTGAYRDKPGLLEMAPNGTVFLDEVGEMSPRMQVVLLRFLESGEIQRVGAERAHKRVDVRLLTATNRDLQSQIASGAFREDLYFRLNVIQLMIPPLRERAADIPLLVEFFLHAYGHAHQVTTLEVSAEAMAALVAYRWPGNIRELKNIVERLVVRAHGPLIELDDLPSEVSRRGAPHLVTSTGVKTGDQQAAQLSSAARELASLMIDDGESFWSAVHPQFMSRDLTRTELRKVVQFGLERANGSYRLLVPLFNMPAADYKRFLNFLRTHDCHLPFQRFRPAPAAARPLVARAG
jgi:transcriptional regulator with GAF, ATPase, and Fis domain